MSASCVDCAVKLSIGRRLFGNDRCAECEAAHEEEQRQERERQRAQYNAAVEAYVEATSQLRLGVDLNTILPRIAKAQEMTPLAKEEVQALNVNALNAWLDQTLDDDVVTRHEDLMLGAVARTLNVQMSPAQMRRYLVGTSNAGLMPRDPTPQIMLNQDEVAYFRVSAGLLTEKVVKEYRTNYQSASFPIGDSGIRYRVGQSRGRQVVVGTSIEVADRGWLTITSERLVFSGAKQVMEFPHRRLVGINIFGDGLGVQVANRKSVPSFRTGSEINDVFAALTNAAVALSRGTFRPPAVQPVKPLPTPPAPGLLADAGYPDALDASVPPPTIAQKPRAEPSAPEVPTPEPVPAAPRPSERGALPDRMDAQVLEMFGQLDRFPGQRDYIDQVKALYAMGGGSREQIEELLDRCYEAAKSIPLPPSLTPHPLAMLPLPERTPRREVPAQLDQTFEQLRELGLTNEQVADLREDYRCEQASEIVLEAVHRALVALANDDDVPSADENKDSATEAPSDQSDGPALRVYYRMGEGSRTRELFDILAASDDPLTPEEIGRRMRPNDDGSVVKKGSVRAAIRNARRVEKGLWEQDAIDREVLLLDYTNYSDDGAARYSLSVEDKAAIRG